MSLSLHRKPSNDTCTLGTLSIDEAFECYTLEDPVHPVKIPGSTAIPAGRYQVIITMSNRFKKDLPLLCAVPGFEGVRIHSGNTAADTEGCILLGKTQHADAVGLSRIALDAFLPKLRALLAHGPVWLDIYPSGDAS